MQGFVKLIRKTGKKSFFSVIETEKTKHFYHPASDLNRDFLLSQDIKKLDTRRT